MDTCQKEKCKRKGGKIQTKIGGQSFHSEYGIDYVETFSPMAEIQSTREIIALVAYYDYELLQMGVKTTF